MEREMGWKPRDRMWNWRACLTADEKQVIAESDAALVVIQKLRAKYNKDMASARQLIVNRAIHRAKYEARKQA
jgi:hypothetical protein